MRSLLNSIAMTSVAALPALACGSDYTLGTYDPEFCGPHSTTEHCVEDPSSQNSSRDDDPKNSRYTPINWPFGGCADLLEASPLQVGGDSFTLMAPWVHNGEHYVPDPEFDVALSERSSRLEGGFLRLFREEVSLRDLVRCKIKLSVFAEWTVTEDEEHLRFVVVPGKQSRWIRDFYEGDEVQLDQVVIESSRRFASGTIEPKSHDEDFTLEELTLLSSSTQLVGLELTIPPEDGLQFVLAQDHFDDGARFMGFEAFALAGGEFELEYADHQQEGAPKMDASLLELNGIWRQHWDLMRRMTRARFEKEGQEFDVAALRQPGFVARSAVVFD